MPSSTQYKPKAGIIVTDQKATADLQINLSERIKKDAIEGLGTGILSNPSTSRVASTKSVEELFKTIPALATLLDDSNTSSEKTWSSEKIVTYVAENDDSVAFSDIAERDAYVLAPERDGVTALVADASADPQVGFDAENNPLGALYLRKNGVWNFLFTKGYKKVNFEGYLNEDSLVGNLETNDPKAPLGANVGVMIASMMSAISSDIENTQIMPEISDITWDAANQQNKVETVYKPKGHPINFECNVIDDVTGRMIPYACEFVDENGVTFMHILMASPVDLSAAKVRFSYLHSGKANV